VCIAVVFVLVGICLGDVDDDDVLLITPQI